MLQPPDMPSKSNNAQLNLNTCFLGHLTQKLRFTSGHAVTQLVEVLRYEPERRGFDS